MKIAKIIPCKSLEFLKLYGFRELSLNIGYVKFVYYEDNQCIKYTIDANSHEIDIETNKGDWGDPVIDDTLFRLYEAGLIEFVDRKEEEE